MIETIIFKDLYATLIDNVAGIKGESVHFLHKLERTTKKKLWSLVELAMVILHHH